MNTFEDIQKHIVEVFQDFLAEVLRLNGEKLSYYYWTADFFESVGHISFQHYPLSLDQKRLISSIGDFYFDNSDIVFTVSRSSHRNNILIRNIQKLFIGEYVNGRNHRYEYVREYILWDILSKLSEAHDKIPQKIVEQQKKNFLSTYLSYLLEHAEKPNFEEFSGYIRYELTNQGEALDKKLTELEAKGVKNDALREKLSKLYVLKEQESNIHFVFSRNQGGDKEELRELLEVMGDKESGKLYRGQADSTWALNASLTREPRYLEYESEMYYEILSLKPDAFTNDTSVYERLITMQHFGMPTRLMDITRNPLVAIFFACNNLDRAQSDGMVYTFSKENKEFLNFEDEKLHGLKYLFDTSCKINNDQRAFLSGIFFIKGVAKKSSHQ